MFSSAAPTTAVRRHTQPRFCRTLSVWVFYFFCIFAPWIPDTALTQAARPLAQKAKLGMQARSHGLVSLILVSSMFQSSLCFLPHALRRAPALSPQPRVLARALALSRAAQPQGEPPLPLRCVPAAADGCRVSAQRQRTSSCTGGTPRRCGVHAIASRGKHSVATVSLACVDPCCWVVRSLVDAAGCAACRA